MCKHPISLKNPSIAWNILNDSLNILVPCNTCSDCENKKRLDWQIRVYYEYLRCRKIGGFTLFMTLTYNDDKLPLAYVDKSGHAKVTPRHRKTYLSYLDSVHNRQVMVHEDHSIVEKDRVMSCFSADDIQRFTENSKDAFRRRGEKMGYMITSEYGHYEPYTDKHNRPVCGTSRPHYHCLFFFDGAVKPTTARKILAEHWLDYGVIDFTNRKDVIVNPSEDGVVSGPGAIGYVCKYLQKSRDNAEALRKHLLLDPGQLDRKELKRLNRAFAPFHKQSYGLGLYILEATPEELLAKGKCKFPLYVSDHGKPEVRMCSVPLPQYIERKLFCLPQSETPNRSYILNDAGVNLKASQLYDRRQDLIQEINDFIEHYNDKVDSQLLAQINNQLGHKVGDPGYFLRPKDFAYEIKKNLENYSVQTLVDYTLLFQGLVNLDNVENVTNGHNVYNYLDSLTDLSEQEFIDISKLRLRKNRSTPFLLDHQKYSYYSSRKIFIPELERAIKLYSAYSVALAYLGEAYVQEKIQREKSSELYHYKNLYSLRKKIC